jgi:hypothetical protein
MSDPEVSHFGPLAVTPCCRSHVLNRAPEVTIQERQSFFILVWKMMLDRRAKAEYC